MSGQVELRHFPVDSRVFIVRCGDVVDGFAVMAERFTLLIDSLISRHTMTDALQLLRTEGALDQPVLVLNTHADWDHVWGNGAFRGPHTVHPATIIAHRIAGERLNGRKAHETLASFQHEDPDRYATSELVSPQITFEGEMTLHGGDLTFQLIPTPGHTPDHVAVFVPELRLLVAGDAAELPFPYVGTDSDLPVLRRTLQRMEALEPDTVLYCHALDLHDPALIAHNRAYFDELEHRCQACLERDRDRATISLLNDPSLLGWPVEQAIPPLAPPEFALSDFHRRGHNRAIHAMIRWLGQ